MSVEWLLVFCLMVAQMVTFILLVVLPRYFRKLLTTALSKLYSNHTFRLFYLFTALLLLVLFADSVNKAVNIREKEEDGHDHDAHHSYHSSISLHTTLFLAQRNMYLSGFSLFLMIVLYGVTARFSEIHEQEATMASITAGYEDSQKLIAKLQSNYETTKAKLDLVEKEIRGVEVLKRQCENQSAEYMRVLDENQKLTDQLAALKPQSKKHD
eukprot:gnl/Hemi2/2727_TR952_c0_g2_i1.p1 gnl/Hemi2/2727_TR952_c0_g2~~gnl/Hemi2/2727_TR952_c0_g2_i1.p1  ORF type:complete len:233 (-),score=102.30 gnl/Hemi2/2727_TR952_c0_g2_i1:58-693(-)